MSVCWMHSENSWKRLSTASEIYGVKAPTFFPIPLWSLLLEFLGCRLLFVIPPRFSWWLNISELERWKPAKSSLWFLVNIDFINTLPCYLLYRLVWLVAGMYFWISPLSFPESSHRGNLVNLIWFRDFHFFCGGKQQRATQFDEWNWRNELTDGKIFDRFE